MVKTTYVAVQNRSIGDHANANINGNANSNSNANAKLVLDLLCVGI